MKEKILGEYNGWQWAQSTYSGALLASFDSNVSKIILLPHRGSIHNTGYDIWDTFWIIKNLNANTFNMTIESVYNGFQNISP